MKNLFFLSIFLCFVISCSTTSSTIETRGPLIQFKEVVEPISPLNLDGKVMDDPSSGWVVCFKPDKAKELRIYIAKLLGSLKEANVTIKQANQFIEKNATR